MAKKIELGAPSRRGRGANWVREAIEGVRYPVKVIITNHCPFEISLPEIRGMSVLKPVFFESSGGNKEVTVIDSEDQFVRIVSTIDQISVLNNLNHDLISIEEVNQESAFDPGDSNHHEDPVSGKTDNEDGKDEDTTNLDDADGDGSNFKDPDKDLPDSGAQNNTDISVQDGAPKLSGEGGKGKKIRSSSKTGDK